jgi:hypothetical protein
LSIYSPADNSPLKSWRTLSASGTIYAERPRIHTPDGLKWRVNESDKVELTADKKPEEYISSPNVNAKIEHTNGRESNHNV